MDAVLRNLFLSLKKGLIYCIFGICCLLPSHIIEEWGWLILIKTSFYIVYVSMLWNNLIECVLFTDFQMYNFEN